MLKDGPIPSCRVIEEMRVMFLAQFLGAFPRALSPFGAPRPARRPPATFFSAPPEPLSDRPTHGRLRDPNSPKLFPQLAVALKGCGVVLFELRPQELPLLFGGQDAPPAPRGEPRREVLALPLLLQPAFEGGQGDAEGLDDLLARHAPLEGRQCPDP